MESDLSHQNEADDQIDPIWHEMFKGLVLGQKLRLIDKSDDFKIHDIVNDVAILEANMQLYQP